ncbi:MAG: PEP-CTERM sorting domain-containing protein [Pseudomonadota bacterium]
MQKIALCAALAGAMGLASNAATAGLLMLSGVLDGTEPTFDNPDTGGTTQTSFDTFDFSVDTTGDYDFLSFYPGDTSIDANLDGFLLLFTAVFDPLSPGASVAFDDDYSAGGIPGLGAFDSACVGSNCSAFSAALTASTSYTLVQTSFTDVPNSFGQPTGPYDITISGPGDIFLAGTEPPTGMPAPATLLLVAGGLLGVTTLRKRKLNR